MMCANLIRTLAVALAAVGSANTWAQGVVVDLQAPATVNPGESFTVTVTATAEPSSIIAAVAGFALDVVTTSGQSEIQSVQSPTFPDLPDGTRVDQVSAAGIEGVVSGQWADIGASNPDQVTDNPIVLMEFVVQVDAGATAGETIAFAPQNPDPAGGVFLYLVTSPSEIVAVPNNPMSVLTLNASMTTVASACPADVNGDGIASPADFTAWLSAFNAMSPECDVNGDTFCSPADFTAWLSAFNLGC